MAVGAPWARIRFDKDVTGNGMPGGIEHWDAFVSHAWEDKETFVRPLVEALGRLGVLAWYDEVSLKLGDSLSGSIDRGIAKSRNGIVVVSTALEVARSRTARAHDAADRGQA